MNTHAYSGKREHITVGLICVCLTSGLFSVSSAQQTSRLSMTSESIQTGVLSYCVPLSRFASAGHERSVPDDSLRMVFFDAPEPGAADTVNSFVPLSRFTYAGQPRYTLDGSLPRAVTEIQPTNLAILGGVYVGAFVFLDVYQRNAWWKDQRGGFHFEEDWVSALQSDKAGHSYGGYIASYVMSEGLTASGFSWDAATLWGAVFGCAYQTYVEDNDGFARQWGFSPSDWYFDVLGPLFFLAQHHVEALQDITPKWEYVPSRWTGEPQIVRPSTFIDDYNSSTFFWSLNVYNILPGQVRKYWLPWLNIAVGYGADAVDANKDPNQPPDQLSQRRYIIALDYDLVRLLPSGGPFWNWFRQSLDYIKLPSPAIEFSNGVTRFSLLYPFRIHFGSVKF